jgi:hypothetical protein
MTNINFTGLTEFEAKEIAYQTCFLMMNGWKKMHLTYDLFEKERPDLYFNKRKDVDSRFEERNHLWTKGDYVAEVSYQPNGWGYETKTSKYFTLEEAYNHQIKQNLIK